MKSFQEKTYIYSVQRECENLQTGSKWLILHAIIKKPIQLYSLFHIFCVSMASSKREQSMQKTLTWLHSVLKLLGSTSLNSMYLGSTTLNRYPKEKSTFECFSLCSADLASVIVQIHLLTGADTTSSFFGRGKKAVIKNVRKNIDEAKELLKNFGKSFTMTEDCFKNVILFVIRFIYMTEKVRL